MNALIIIGLALFAVSVSGETCSSKSDCVETSCNYQHGFWLHCTKGLCLCGHDSFVGNQCDDGLASTCQSVHGSRCQDHGMNWHCLDGVCHCSKH